MNLASEGGLARLNTTARVSLVLVILSLVTFDLGAVVVNIFQLEDLSNDAAQAAAVAWRSAPRAAVVEAAVAEHVAASEDVEVSRIALDATTVWVTLQRPPATLVLDKFPPVRERLDFSITQRAALDPRGL